MLDVSVLDSDTLLQVGERVRWMWELCVVGLTLIQTAVTALNVCNCVKSGIHSYMYCNYQ